MRLVVGLDQDKHPKVRGYAEVVPGGRTPEVPAVTLTGERSRLNADIFWQKALTITI